MTRKPLAAIIAVVLTQAFIPAHAADDATLEKIRNEIEQLKQTDDTRIGELEQRLQQAERNATPPQKANAFNPAISLILSGTYAHLSQDPANYQISNFPVPTDVEIGPGFRGFSLTESELGIYANVDPYFYGGLNLAVAPDNTFSVEEAFIQTTALSNGFTLKAGRYFSSIGYLNSQHTHTWDFVDVPLSYQAFLGGQYGDDGVQLRWLAPLDTFLELGGELGRGREYPGSSHDSNNAGMGSLFVHIGGDLGVSHSWRTGLSVLATSPNDQLVSTVDSGGNAVTNSFSGDMQLWIADFVWKYAPNGNPVYTNFKLQGEYLWRRQDGDLLYNVGGSATPGRFTSTQAGWYLQAVYQFHPYWRVGVRSERLDAGNVDYGANSSNLASTGYDPTKNSIMLDYNLSEFSRIRVQVARDRANEGSVDDEVFVQYQMGLGAHGAHNF